MLVGDVGVEEEQSCAKRKKTIDPGGLSVKSLNPLWNETVADIDQMSKVNDRYLH
jgi:DNA-directed RNA polymerase alpha subunit